ncbi:ankyrin repeat domain-containing protein [Sulfurimonas diazotrophicus]|uniref:Ankyrin repeat domain-containing protein n=1 Tax=Sulfurimonas diazotrophicus TaxID=3131939 RepID=A0ABZ3HCW6_9BACT
MLHFNEDIRIDAADDGQRTVPIRPSALPEYLGTDDPIVLKTTWQPLGNSGYGFKTHRLVRVSEDRMEFRRSFQSLLLTLLFSVGAAGSLFLGFSGVLGTKTDPLLFLLFSFSFSGLAVFFYFSGRKRIVIDKAISAFWRGKEEPTKVINPHAINGYHSLKNVHAVQLLKRFIPGDHDSKSFYKHELNLVFADGNRAAVIDHNDAKTVTKQGQRISDFLEVPLWDARSDIPAPSPLSHLSLGKPFEYMMRLLHLYRRIKLYAALTILAIGFSTPLIMYFASPPAKEDKKINLLTVTWAERQQLEPQYTAELFELVKNPTEYFVPFSRLVDTRLDLNAKDELGRTPLYYAVLNKNIDYVNTLLRKGADIHVRDNKGIGLIDLLDKKRDAYIYEKLLYAQLEEDARKRGKEIFSVSYRILPDGTLVVKELKER